MRAAVATGINETEPLSMLELRDDWPDPIPPEGHTIVRVGATSINMHDLWSMRGVGVRADQFPMILGCDIAGWDEHGNEVVVSGSFGNPDAGHGDESFDPDRALVSERFPGSFAERTIVPLRNVVPKPAFLSMEEAGCITVAWTTAYRMLFTRGRAEAGETVLIQGAGGGVATAAAALARALLVCASSSPAGLRRSASVLWPSVRTRPSKPEPDCRHLSTSSSRRLGKPRGSTACEACDPVDGSSCRARRRVPTPAPISRRIFYRQISVIGVSGASRVETEQLLRFMEAADLHPLIDSVYPFEDIHAAFERAQQPDLYGKVVVRMDKS